MPFKKGENGGAKGGPRPGAGRPPDGLREMCKDIILKRHLVQRLGSIAEGEDIPQPISNGEVIPIPAPVAEQRKAIADLIDRAYGKPDQSFNANVTGDTHAVSLAELAGVAARIAELLASCHAKDGVDTGK